jgi:Flp pilus assembly CpaF family ATPase
LLGWRILKEGEYMIDLPILSRDEEELIIGTEERFKERCRIEQTKTRKESGEAIRSMLLETADARGIYLESDQRAYLPKIALMHIYGFAFLDPLLGDESIEEISIIGPMEPAFVYVRGSGWKEVNACFCDERSITDAANRMAREIGRHITLQNPRLDAMLPDGSRLHASLSPVSRGEITIRRFRGRPFTPRELVENRTISADAISFLSIIMQCDCSLVIGGNTASGKTTTLNALFSFVPGDERIVITEETPEINIPHRHQIRLVSNRDMGITLKDLVYDSLRMRPDRMIVGEVRNREEAEALFEVLLAGQARGSYATIHAQSVDEGIRRLASFGIAKEDLESADCILTQRRMLNYDPEKRSKHEIRRVCEIAEIRREGCKKTLYDGKKLDVGGSVLFQKAASAFGMTEKELVGEMKGREKLIRKAGPEFLGFYETVQKELYGVNARAGRKIQGEGKTA